MGITSTPVLIRAMRGQESDAARRLIRGVWREHFGAHEDPYVRDFMSGPAALRDLDDVPECSRGTPRRAFLGGWCGSRLVAVGGLVEIDPRTAELRHLFVRAGFRRRGIGARLSRSLIEVARSWRVAEVRLGSNKALHASHRLYRRLGFRETAPFEVGGERYAVYMVLDLDGTAGDHRVRQRAPVG